MGMPEPPPTCKSNTGWRNHARECGRPATHGMSDADDESTLLWLCDAHAATITDMTGARLVRHWSDEE